MTDAVSNYENIAKSIDIYHFINNEQSGGGSPQVDNGPTAPATPASSTTGRAWYDITGWIADKGVDAVLIIIALFLIYLALTPFISAVAQKAAPLAEAL
jgi:hypothetical protein